MNRDELTATFQEAVANVITQHWALICPGAADDDELEDLEVADEMGATYPSAWVLVIGTSSIENADAPHAAVRYAPRGQSPFAGIGLLEDALFRWKVG